jgi:hypothetical protein
MSRITLSAYLWLASSAIFPGVAGAASATFLQNDTSTLGNWKGVYGQDGNVIAQHSVQVPSYSTFNTAGNVNLNVLDIWATDPRALLKQYYSYSSTERIESYFHTGDSMDFLITSSDGQTHRIALYFADYQNQNRSNTVKVLDTATGATLDSRALTNYSGGVYLLYNYSGNVTFRIVNNNPGQYNPTALVNAFFWGGGGSNPPPPPSDTTPPTVSIATPSAGNVSGTVTVTANAADNVGVANVQYQLDGSNLGSAQTSSPYSFSWNTAGVSNGSHMLTAIATDTSGNHTTSAGVTVNVNNVQSDATPPTITITAPTAGTVSGTVNVTASASDNVGVANVQYQLDGANLGSPQTGSPYTYAWNTNGTSNGSHVLTAVATDTSGNHGTSASVTVNVSNGPVTSSNNATFVGIDNTTLGNWKGVYGQDGNVIAQSSIVVPSYASFDTSGDINLKLIDLWSTDPTALLKYQPSYSSNERVKSEFFTPTFMTFKIGSNDGQTHRLALYFANYENFPASGNNNLGLLSVTDPVNGRSFDTRTILASSAPTYVVYNYTGSIIVSVAFISPSAGPYAVLSGFFWGGGGSVPSGPPPAADTTPPVVSMSTPSNGATVSGTITVAANATDDKGVASVQFQINNGNVGGPVTSSPYQVSWNTTGSTNGQYVIKAIATDTSGNTSSASITVTVNNQTTPPPPPPPPPPSSGNSVTFVGQDNNTKGNWKGVYGQDGNFICQESYTAPSYSIFNPINVNQLIISDTTDDVRAPLKMYYSYSPTERFMSHWYNRFTMDFQVTATDGQSHRIALYFADWVPLAPNASFYPNIRSITVQAINTDTGAILDSRPLTDYTGGVYFVYNYSGNITFRIVNNWDGDRSHPNGTVSAFYWGGSGMPQ